MERPDEIVKTVVAEAPLERVWAAITDPAEIAQWFGDSAEVDLQVGGAIRFGWSHFDNSVAHAVIEQIDEPTTFAYRWWMAEADESLATLVTFTLAAVAGGTEVTVVESRLSNLSVEQAAKTIRENSEGWEEELDDLAGYLLGAS